MSHLVGARGNDDPRKQGRIVDKIPCGCGIKVCIGETGRCMIDWI